MNERMNNYADYGSLWRCQSRWVEESGCSDWPGMSISRLADVEQRSRLPLWRVSVDVDASPVDVADRLRRPVHTAADCCTTLGRWKTLERPTDDVDLVEYAVTLPAALDRTRYFRVLRYRRMVLSSTPSRDVTTAPLTAQCGERGSRRPFAAWKKNYSTRPYQCRSFNP